MKFFVMLSAFFLTISCHHKVINTEVSARKIVIQVEMAREIVYQKPANFVLKDELELEYLPLKATEYSPQWSSVKTKISERKIKWVLYSDIPIQANYGFGRLSIVNPGDSINVRYNGKKSVFAGKGTDKLLIWEEVRGVGERMIQPTRNNLVINSVEDYLAWNEYIDNKLTQQIAILNFYMRRIQPFEYDYFKEVIVSSAEDDRLQAFSVLKSLGKKGKLPNLKPSNLSAIWDSTQYKHWSQWLRSLSDYYGSLNALYQFNQFEVQNRFGFELNSDSFINKEMRGYMYYDNAKRKFKGLLRERLMAYTLYKLPIAKRNVGSPIVQSMLTDYYSQSRFPECKKWIKSLEDKKKEN